MDVEAQAAAALADEAKAGPVVPQSIDFTCEHCDAAVSLPLDLAGRRAPCPECRRILRVPEPAVTDPTNWRKKDALPSAARRPDEKPPEGAWGSTGRAGSVSVEALQEAQALPSRKRIPLTVREWVFRGAVAAAAVLVVAGGAVWAWTWWAHGREEQSVLEALAYADSDDGKAQLGGEGRASLYLLAGEYSLRTKRGKCAAASKERMEKALSFLTGGDVKATERDAVLIDLAVAEAELGGSAEEADDGRKLKWDEVQKLLRATLTAVQAPEARVEALRGVARRLATQGQGDRVLSLVANVYSKTSQEQAEALGAAGLELRAAGQTAAAEKAAERAVQVYAVEKDRPALAASAVALAVALNKQPPKPAAKGEKAAEKDEQSELIGRAEGLARAGLWEQARAMAGGAPPEARLQALTVLAAAALDDKGAGPADAEAAVRAAAEGANDSAWLMWRVVRIGAKAGVAEDALRAAAAAAPDRDLKGRAQLAALQAAWAKSNQEAPASALEAIDAETPAHKLARAAWARHNARLNSETSAVVKAWEPPLRAFGSVGVSLGLQGE
jgi:hypothetical protein